MAGTAQDPPALKSIIYDGSVILASWDPATGSGKLFVITLFENGSAKTSAQGYDRSGMLPVDRKSLDLARTYTVKVAESDGNLNPVGPYSNEIVLIPEAPSTVKTDYDGVRITVSFTPPETAVEIEGGKLSLFEKSQSKLIQSVNFAGDSFIFKPSSPLKPSTGYFITVACQNPGSLGPASGPAEIVQDTVEIANVTYDGQTIKTTASQTVPDPYLLVLRLYADGRFVKEATGKGNEVTLAPQDKLVLWKRYEVCMARFIENSRGPLSAPMPVLSTTPVLQGVSYDGAYLKASWENLPGYPVPTGGALMIFQDETLVQSFDAQGNSACVQLPSALPDNKENKLRVAATYGPSRGAVSQSLDIITSIKQLTSAQYDGGKITAAWPSGTGYGVTGYLLSLLENGIEVIKQHAGGTTGTINFRLNPNSNYSLSLQGTGYNTSGPDGTNPLISAITGIRTVVAKPDGVTVELDVVTPSPNVTGYVTYLYQGDKVVAGPVAAAGSPPTAVFDYTVSPQYSYSVKARATGVNCSGPLSEAVDVISGVPVVKEILYDGVNTFISWSPVRGGEVTGYSVRLEDKGGGSVQTFPTPLTSISIPVDKSKSYSVQVQASGNKSTGILSPVIDIIKETINVASAYYDGEFIRAAWPAASTPGAEYEVLLLDGNDVSDCFTFTATSAAIPAVLNHGGTYSLQLRLAVDGVTGPGGTSFPVVTAVPDIVSITAGAGNVTVIIDDSSSKGKPGVAGCRAVLYRGGDIVAGPVEASGSPLTAVFNYTISQQYSYSVKAQAAGSSCSGPWSGAAGVIAGIPVIDAINYDELTAFISWSAVSQDSVTGYTVTLKEKNGGFKQNFSTPGTNITIPVDRSKSFNVQVQARGNNSLGRFSDAVDIINESIELNSVLYDSEFIRAAWPVAATPGAVYEVLLLDGDDVSDSFTVTVNDAAIPAVLDPGGTYSLQLRLAVENVTGPGGASFPVVTAAPGIVSVTAGADNVSVVIDDSACKDKPGVTGCRAVLYRGGDIVAGPVEAAGSPLTAVFDYTVSQQYSYSVKVQAAGSSCSGPWSGAAGVIAGIPVIDTIHYDELTAFISWSAVSQNSVTGYTVALKEKNGGFKQSFSAAGTSISIPVDRTRNFSVQVQARSNYSLGRFSDAVDIINESIELTSVFYDGEIIMASWPATSTPDVSYIALLMDGDDLKGSHHTSTNSVVIPAFLDQGGSYSLQLRLLKDSVIGPCGGAFPVVSAAPGIVSLAAAADRVTVAIDDAACRGKPGITGCQAILCRGGDPVAGPVDASGSPLTASFDYAVSPQYGYSVKVRAAGANCSGPWSADAAVIPAAPEIIEAVYSGSNIMVGWTPLATCPVTGYAATLTPADDISKAVTVYSSGTTAAIPFDASGASGAYTVSVRGLCDSSSGPASAPVDPIGPGLCLSSEKDKAPAVKPASNSLPPAPIEVACLLPELYKTPPSTLPSEGPFALTPLDGAGDLKYKIAFQPNSDLWSFDSSPLRTAIQQHYTKFLSALEGKLPDQPPPTIGTLLPGAVQTVIENLARVMPQTFAETLYYNYGFYAAYSYADLRPGLRLRLEYEQWQTVSSQSAGTTQYFNGYTGNTVAEYDIGSFTDSMGVQRVGFNSFLSNLDGLLVPTPKGSGAGPVDGGGGNIDFLFREFQQPFYRLFYPSTFKAPYEQGSCFPKDNAMIVAAADWTTLESITSAIIAGRGSSLPAIGANYAMFYLRGRTVMTPLICLTLNGARIWTPVGTILSQLLEQSAVKPLNVSAAISGLRYLRVWGGHYSATSQGLNFNIGRLPVRFQWGASTVYANSSGWFSLPVLHGDIIEFAEERP